MRVMTKYFKIFVIALLVLCFTPIILKIVFDMGYLNVMKKFSTGDWLAYYGTVLSCFATAILGIIVCWQGTKMSEYANKTNETLKDLTLKANEISQR